MRLLVRVLKRYAGEIRPGNPWQVLVSCVLSQRTKEEKTAEASRRLFSRARTPEELEKLGLRELEKLIKPAGFYRQKARRLKEIAKILLERYGGTVPRTREELLKLPGVGWKTSAVVLSYGWGIPIIAVDTHTARISKRLGLVRPDAGPEDVRKRLEGVFRKQDWLIVNLGMVNFGRQVCRPIRPRCEECPLKRICKFYNDRLSLPSRTARVRSGQG